MFNPMFFITSFINPTEIIGSIKNNPNSLIIIIAVLIAIISLYYLYKFYAKYELKLVPKIGQKEPTFLLDGLLGDKEQSFDSKYFLKSSTGNEYTFSFWLYLNSIDFNYGEWKHVLSKGNIGLNEPEQSPGIYIHPKKNALRIIIATINGVESFDIDDIYLKKWVQIAITANDNTLEIYMNGSLLNTYILKSRAKFCDGNLTVNSKGNYQGAIASIDYFPESKTSSKIYDIYTYGPGKESLTQKTYRTLTFGADPMNKLISKLPESSTVGPNPVQIVTNKS